MFVVHDLTLQVPGFQVSSTDGGLARVAVQLDAETQAAAMSAGQTAHELCCAAQHALGYAAYGSRIRPELTAVEVYLGSAPALQLHGQATLWFVSHAAPAALRTFLQAIFQALPAPTPAAQDSV